jgi:hypothetical protein
MRTSARAMLIVGGLLFTVGACERPPDAVEITATEELPGGAWLVAARRERRALLVPGDRTRRRVDIGAPVPTAGEHWMQTLTYERGHLAPGPQATFVAQPLSHPPVTDTLHHFVVEFDNALVRFARTGDSPLREAPGARGTYLLERQERLWLVTADGVRQVTRDTALGIARDTLARRAREEGPHLFWASAAVWSPDGRRVAYVTNRSWMLSPRGGQEIWLVDVQSGAERPLLSEEGRSFYPDGWLGEEVVFRSDEPGFAGANASDGQRRTLGPGTPVAFTPARLLYMMQEGERWSAHILSASGTEPIPPPPQGEMLVHGGAFSPSGERLLLETALEADSGITRTLYLYDLRSRRLDRLLRWNHREQDRTPVGLPRWLDDSALLLTRFDRTTGRESSTLLRLGSGRR